MNTIEFIKMSLENNKAFALGLITDMQDAPLTQPTSNGGNHPLWILGHLVCSESDLLDVFILGKPNRFPQWEDLFSIGSVPSSDANDYPTMDELCAEFEKIRAASLAHLATLGESDLEAPSHAPDKFGPFFSTVGSCFAAMCTHQSFHAGQVSVCRRAAGRQPLMA